MRMHICNASTILSFIRTFLYVIFVSICQRIYNIDVYEYIEDTFVLKISKTFLIFALETILQLLVYIWMSLASFLGHLHILCVYMFPSTKICLPNFNWSLSNAISSIYWWGKQRLELFSSCTSWPKYKLQHDRCV